ncbi:hypothetical protein [Ammoniphilus sp. 3BR4]|uniref:hypothetical protein n=1 Tax=Ammoniphilus sp. 3BR4 TaxID=3158265 RepID=UPI0034678B51
MAQHILTNFTSPEEAERAKDYLISAGFENISVTGSQVEVSALDENWIAAYEILNGLGGSFEEEGLPQGFEENYRLNAEDDSPIPEQDLEMVDPEAYIDQNLGYGDYEIVEPYILHDFAQMTERED